jgi:acyl-[acyl-carrier-protein] desaturase
MTTFDSNNSLPERPNESTDLNADERQILQRTLTGGRAGEPDFVPTAPRRGSVNAQVEEIFFENFLKYFKNAEEKRRWSIARDVPWDKCSADSSEVTAQIVESFTAVEMYLPDYTHKIMELIRRSRGRAWFQSNWGYEESKHSIVLEEWLVRSGKRTEEQMRDFENELLGAEWQLPFDSPRQMIIYTMIQELATGVNYTNLRRRAEGEGDEALARTLRWVSADESAHYNFFRKGVKTYLSLEPDETIRDIKFVFEHFAMPAHALIPEWQERGEAIEAAGIYGPKMYLSKIRRPILEDLNISRTQLKEAGLPIPEADEAADRAEALAIEAKEREAGRTYSVGGCASPLQPPHRTRILPLGV